MSLYDYFGDFYERLRLSVVQEPIIGGIDNIPQLKLMLARTVRSRPQSGLALPTVETGYNRKLNDFRVHAVMLAFSELQPRLRDRRQ